VTAWVSASEQPASASSEARATACWQADEYKLAGGYPILWVQEGGYLSETLGTNLTRVRTGA
jgi:hypothetical protein